MRRILCVMLCLSLMAAFPAAAESMTDFLERGMGFEEEQRYAEAFACYDIAARLEPEAAEPLLAAAALRLETGAAEEALALTDAALAVEPASGQGWLLRTRICIALDDAYGAESDLLYAAVCRADYEEYGEVSAQLGTLWCAMGEYEKAVACLQYADPAEMTEEQRLAYRRVLLRAGRMDVAVALGLMDESERDAELEAAFELGALKLAREDRRAADIESYRVTAPAALLEESSEMPYEVTYSEDGRTAHYTVPASESGMDMMYMLDVSPDGETVLMTSGTGIFAALNGDHAVLLSAVYDRGVEDVYGNLAYLAGDMRRFPGREGFAWSPDGRYIALTNCYDALSNGRLAYDLILADLHTGEVFLAATYSRKMREGGAVTHARFDASGKWLYYLLFGGQGEERTALMRYDMETGAVEECLRTQGITSLPCLVELADGRLMHLTEVIKKGEHFGVSLYSEAGGGFSCENVELSQPAENVALTYLNYSAGSGYALAQAKLMSGLQDNCLIRFLPEQGMMGMDEYWVIESLDADAAVRVDVEALRAEIDAELQAKLEKNSSAVMLERDLINGRYVCFNAVQLSPDGHYALIAAEFNREFAYMLLDLETMALRRVEVPEELAGHRFRMDMKYTQGVKWCSDGRIVIREDAKLAEVCRLRGE